MLVKGYTGIIASGREGFQDQVRAGESVVLLIATYLLSFFFVLRTGSIVAPGESRAAVHFLVRETFTHIPITNALCLRNIKSSRAVAVALLARRASSWVRPQKGVSNIGQVLLVSSAVFSFVRASVSCPPLHCERSTMPRIPVLGYMHW